MRMALGAFKWLAAAAVSAVALSGCGGGGAADPFAPGPALPSFVVRPTAIEAFSGTPVTISVVSGVGPFLAFSSNPAVLPVTQAVSGTAITVTPAAVSAVTAVTLTVRDAAGREQPVAVNVNPGSVLSQVTVTPVINSQCGQAAPPAPVPVCSGDTASISTLVRNAGATPVAGRQIRFDVVQGAFAFSLSSAGATTAPSTTVLTDANGIANAVIKVVEGVTSQVAIVRATDTVTGNRVDTVFTIVQQINGQAVLSVVPQEGYVGQAFYKGECGGTSGDFLVYGGNPPYTARSSLPNAVQLSYRGVIGDPVTIPTAGDRFRASTVYSLGCTGFKAQIVVTDSAGRNFQVSYEEKEGTNDRPTPPAPDALAITPSAVTLVASGGNCGGRFLNFRVTGGVAPYTFASSEPLRLIIDASGRATTCSSASNPSAIAASPYPGCPSNAQPFLVGTTISVSALDAAGKIISANVNCTNP